MHQFKKLKVWEKSRLLVKKAYLLTEQLLSEELYRLTNQIRRASVSIAANISEGCGRETDKDLHRFLNIANGSTFGLETLLILASDLNYLNKSDLNPIYKDFNEIGKMIYSLKQKR